MIRFLKSKTPTTAGWTLGMVICSFGAGLMWPDFPYKQVVAVVEIFAGTVLYTVFRD